MRKIKIIKTPTETPLKCERLKPVVFYLIRIISPPSLPSPPRRKNYNTGFWYSVVGGFFCFVSVFFTIFFFISVIYLSGFKFSDVRIYRVVQKPRKAPSLCVSCCGNIRVFSVPECAWSAIIFAKVRHVNFVKPTCFGTVNGWANRADRIHRLILMVRRTVTNTKK